MLIIIMICIYCVVYLIYFYKVAMSQKKFESAIHIKLNRIDLDKLLCDCSFKCYTRR